MKTFNIGDMAYIVRHCPWWPSEDEKDKINAEGKCIIDIAYNKETERVFTGLSKAVAFARRAVKTDFWGRVEIYEAELSNPYRDDIPDYRIKRSALRWEQVEGGYECEIEKR